MPDETLEAGLYWDPIDTTIDASPYAIWRRLRDEAPVYRNERYDFWALSRYADVAAAHRDPATFLSSHGTVLEIMTPNPVPSGLMIFQDPPEHTRLRALVSRAFTPRRVSQLEDHIRELCEALLAPWVAGAEFDFVEDFGATLPSMVICELLGVPPSDRAWVKDRIDSTFHIEPGVGMVNQVSFAARIELDGYLTDLLRRRAESPGDDLLSGLTQADLTLRESADFANLLVSAGTETVARLLGWAAVVLDEHPDQRAELAADPSLIPNAVEELLRYEAPSPVQGRWTSRAVELHGTEIPEGSKVLLLTGSAGRDERAFPDPDRFDVRRRFDHHLSFGFGIHFCLGAALARLEGRVALEEALRRHPTWEVDRARAVRLHTSTVRGWARVPVR
jgi:cytochrome P450